MLKISQVIRTRNKLLAKEQPMKNRNAEQHTMHRNLLQSLSKYFCILIKEKNPILLEV